MMLNLKQIRKMQILKYLKKSRFDRIQWRENVLIDKTLKWNKTFFDKISYKSHVIQNPYFI